MEKTGSSLRGKETNLKVEKQKAKQKKRQEKLDERIAFLNKHEKGLTAIGLLGASLVLAILVAGHAAGVPAARRDLNAEFAEIKGAVLKNSDTLTFWSPANAARTNIVDINDISDADLQNYPEGTQGYITAYKDKQARVDEIQKRVDQIKTRLNELETEKDSGYQTLLNRRNINSEASGLKAELESLKSELSTLDGEMNGLYNSILNDITKQDRLTGENDSLKNQLNPEKIELNAAQATNVIDMFKNSRLSGSIDLSESKPADTTVDVQANGTVVITVAGVGLDGSQARAIIQLPAINSERGVNATTVMQTLESASQSGDAVYMIGQSLQSLTENNGLTGVKAQVVKQAVSNYLSARQEKMDLGDGIILTTGAEIANNVYVARMPDGRVYVLEQNSDESMTLRRTNETSNDQSVYGTINDVVGSSAMRNAEKAVQQRSAEQE